MPDRSDNDTLIGVTVVLDTPIGVSVVLDIQCVPCSDDRHELCAERVSLDLWSMAIECGCVCRGDGDA